MPWLTGDDVTLAAKTINLPIDDWFYAAFIGSLFNLANIENWDEYGTITPDQAAELFYNVIASIGEGGTSLFTKIRRTSAWSFSTGVAQTLSWSDAPIDEIGCWDAGDPTKITFPEDGWYRVTANLTWAVNATGTRTVTFRQPAAPFYVGGAHPGWLSYAGAIPLSQVFYAEAGQYTDLKGTQNSGGTLGVSGSSTLDYTFCTVEKLA